MIPTSREEFKAYCMRKLGEPVIKINVAQEQVEDRIDEALFRFYEKHFDAVAPFFLMYAVTEDDVNAGYIQLPNNVVAITDVARPQIFQGTSSLEYQTAIQNIMSFSQTFSMGQNLVYYITSQSYMTLLNRYFSPQREFSFNKMSNQIIMKGGDLINAYQNEGYMIIRGFKKIDSEAVSDSNGDQIIANIWGVRWLMLFTVALIREQWAHNMGKFGRIEMLGGVTINAADMLAEAQQELADLEQQLTDEYQLPIDFFVG